MVNLLLFRAICLFGLLTLLVWETFYRSNAENNLTGKATSLTSFVNFYTGDLTKKQNRIRCINGYRSEVKLAYLLVLTLLYDISSACEQVVEDIVVIVHNLNLYCCLITYSNVSSEFLSLLILVAKKFFDLSKDVPTHLGDNLSVSRSSLF